MNKEDLKIEFRAVPYASSHVLEYRFSPNQDLRYDRKHCWLWGLIEFRTISKLSTAWKQLSIFRNYSITCEFVENDPHNYVPIFIHNKEELEKFKYNYKTYGDFMKWYNEEEQKELTEYRKDRKTYLEQKGIWS